MFQPKKEFRKLGLRFREKAQPHESAVHSTQSHAVICQKNKASSTGREKKKKHKN
jgi:hypothetical protein